MERIQPRLKSTLRLFRIGDRLYLNSSGIASEIPDSAGSIEYLLEAMDGQRTLEQICALVSQHYPSITAAEILRAIEQMDQAGFLENAAFQAQDSDLTAYDVQRWERNLNFLGSFANLHTNKYGLQARLKSARVALLGLGGLGSLLLYDLVALGVQSIRAVEFDRIELSNLNRQILYTEADVGRPKAEAAAERILAFNPHLNFEVLPLKMSSMEDVSAAIQDCDCVLCVADRPKMELIGWVNEACVRQQIPLINGGLDVQRAMYYSMIPGVTGCVECWRRQVARRDPLSSGLLDEKRRLHVGGENAAFVPLVTLVGGLMLSEFVRLTTHIAPPAAAGRLIEIRFASTEIRQAEQWEKLDDCPICREVPSAVKASA
ncbi:MAG TPA: ThiF family adenylyltransferase [Ktedonobacteraceae bacterium]|jgi:molybdopterin/thiamine biosynthesis adenylyltransferase